MRRAFGKIWPLLLFFAIWEAGAHLFGIPAYILPAPDRVIARVFTDRALLSTHAFVSIIEILAGFTAAALAGFGLAIVIVYSRRLQEAIEPFLVVSQVIPKVALAPLFVIWFGNGLQPKMIIAGTIAFFPVLVNTALGLKAVDCEIIELMDSIAASRRQIFWRVRLPNSWPYILPSLKVAALLSVVGAMVGEFVGSDRGLGYLMVYGDVNLDTDLLFAALIIVTLVGLVLYGAVEIVERRVARRYGANEPQRLVTI
jgi:NitT/TauT family transport system permease protein